MDLQPEGAARAGAAAPFQIRAVGTEVFRRAENGPAFLARVERELGIRVVLVPQEREAELGWRTGLAIFEAERGMVERGGPRAPPEDGGIGGEVHGAEGRDQHDHGANGGPTSSVSSGSAGATSRNACNPLFDVHEEARKALRGESRHLSLPLSNLSGSTPADGGGPLTKENLVVYDTGGGSFQMVCGGDPCATPAFHILLLGSYGVAHAVEDLMSTLLFSMIFFFCQHLCVLQHHVRHYTAHV